MVKTKRKDIHLHFRSHTRGESYYTGRVPKAVKTFVCEEAGGSRELEPEIPPFGFSKYDRSSREFLQKLRDRGVKVVAGEHLRDDPEEHLMETLITSEEDAREDMLADPTNLDSIKNYYFWDSCLQRYRHTLIRITLREAEKYVEGIFGVGHSLISGELGREGIDSSRTISPLVFDWHDIALRKLLWGVPVSDIEYKKAYVCKTIPAEWVVS